MGKSVNTIMVMGILTTIFMLCLSLFTLQHNPQLKEILDMAEQIKFDTNAHFVSINKRNKREKLHYKILIISREMLQMEIDDRVEQIGEYVWLKFGKEKKFDSLEVVYDVKTGSGCSYESIARVQKNIKKPK